MREVVGETRNSKDKSHEETESKQEETQGKGKGMTVENRRCVVFDVGDTVKKKKSGQGVEGVGDEGGGGDQ